MRSRDLATWVTLTVLVCVLFTTANGTAGKKIVNLDDRGHALDFSKTVPGQLNYQGLLANTSDSSTITATLEMTFRLFDSETKGAELWSETHPAVEIQGGLFQVLLGSVAAFPAGLFDGTQLWLQTEVDAEVLAPRKPLMSTAYSHRANSAEMLLDNTLTDLDDRWVNEEQASSVTSAMIADDEIVDADVSVTADIHPGKIAGTAWTADNDGTGSGLDADLLDGQEAAAFLGTANDYGRSGVATDLYEGTTALSDKYVGTDDLDHLEAADGDPADAVFVDNDGKVGIGTTTPARPLDVAGAVNAATYYGDGSNLTGISGTTDNDWTIDGDDVYHETGNVGIGTASPSAKLDVDGAVNTDSLYKIEGTPVLSTKGSQNVFVGANAGANNTGGYATFVGAYAGLNNQGGDNVFVGRRSGYSNATGGSNTYLGQVAGYYNTDGSSNTFLGSATGFKNTTGNYNTFLGRHAGYSNTTGSGNVFVGYKAGYYETGSDKLYIANGKDASDVLIFGDFSTGRVGIGTQIPDAQLHVVGDTDNYGYIGSSDNGVYGEHGASGNYGRLGTSACGVYGKHSSSANFGRLGDSNYGVYGLSLDSVGVNGYNVSSGNYGYLGSSKYGVYGEHYSSGNTGYLGNSDYGVYGKHSSSGNFGLLGSSNYGVHGYANTDTSVGVYGMHGTSGNYGWLADDICGVHGRHDGSGNWGDLGTSSSGVHGYSFNDYGVYGYSGSGYAGYFLGDVHITGDLTGGKTLIDHPLDPENKMLRHNFVESPENLLIYCGKVHLDDSGEAVVVMPDYFPALTKEDETSIHLTPEGRPFLVGYEWNRSDCSFIVYGEPSRDVSWMVLADRDDPVIRQLARPVEEDKGPENKFCDRGELLYPTAYGYPESMGRDYKDIEDTKKYK